jgi:hypothetical protein
MDVNEIGGEGPGWIYLVQDKDQRMALVNMVYDPSVFVKRWGFLE